MLNTIKNPRRKWFILQWEQVLIQDGGRVLLQSLRHHDSDVVACELDVVQPLCVCACARAHSCSYSQCGLPWFQGMVASIPAISGASLRDVLGSLMLSIVGRTKPLPVALPHHPSPLILFFFFCSCHSLPFSFTYISSVVSELPLADTLFTSSLLKCGPLRHVWGTSRHASLHSLCSVVSARNISIMNNWEMYNWFQLFPLDNHKSVQLINNPFVGRLLFIIMT